MNQPPACVAILLSTYNGERYLNDQLVSFSAQTHPDWLLYWRDDGSTDATSAVMQSFSAASGRCMPCPPDRHMGATASFLALLRTALDGPARFFAFSDQDDVWLPDKLAHGVEALEALPAGRPGLFFCGRTLVDASLRPVGQVLAPPRLTGFPAALTQNVAPGCCMMLNRAAAALIDAGPVPEETWHDWWAYLVVSAHAGLVAGGDTPDILYRQHGTNLVGEPRGFVHRTVGAARRGRAPFMNLFRRHVAALQASAVRLPDRTLATLAAIDEARSAGLLARVRLLRLPGFVRQTRAENLLFRLWFVLG